MRSERKKTRAKMSHQLNDLEHFFSYGKRVFFGEKTHNASFNASFSDSLLRTRMYRGYDGDDDMKSRRALKSFVRELRGSPWG
jgi:adenylate cyclase